jgi:hypothetical protein
MIPGVMFSGSGIARGSIEHASPDRMIVAQSRGKGGRF